MSLTNKLETVMQLVNEARSARNAGDPGTAEDRLELLRNLLNGEPDEAEPSSIPPQP
jgi:hypothetical protein